MGEIPSQTECTNVPANGNLKDAVGERYWIAQTEWAARKVSPSNVDGLLKFLIHYSKW